MAATVRTPAQAVALASTPIVSPSWDMIRICAQAEIARGAEGLAQRLADAEQMIGAVGLRNAGGAVGALVDHLRFLARADDRADLYGGYWM